MPVAERDSSIGTGRPKEALIIAGCSLCAYLLVSAVLVFRFHVITVQALSSVANAQAVILSGDPHLAAIGFVGSPLQPLIMLPLVALTHALPAVGQFGFDANLVSALFAAGAVFELYRLLAECQIAVTPRRVLALLFATHPLIVYSAVTGLSEPIAMYLILVVVRHLLRWVHRQEPHSLVVAGAGLACACLVRPESAAAVAGAMVLVGVVLSRRSAHPKRVWTAASGMLIVASPAIATVSAFAGITWLITGELFHPLTSAYGYVAQLQAVSPRPRNGGINLILTLSQILAIAPGLPAAAIAFGTRRRGDLRTAAALAVFGPILAVMVAANLLGFTSPWLRYFTLLVPLVMIVLALTLLAPGGAPSTGHVQLRPLATVLILALGLGTAAVAVANPVTGQDAAATLLPLLKPATGAGTFGTAAQAASFIDGLRLKDGSVLLDTFTGFSIEVASRNPRTFIITSDRNFSSAVADPATLGVRYILVPAPTYLNYLGSLDAVNRSHPALFYSGAGLATLVREFMSSNGRVEWRLYRVVPARSARTGSPGWIS